MARPNKQMIGMSYHVSYHGDQSATIECAYRCPYCDHNTTAGFEVNSDATSIIERGGFFEPLRCNLCGKVADVRFLKDHKI